MTAYSEPLTFHFEECWLVYGSLLHAFCAVLPIGWINAFTTCSLANTKLYSSLIFLYRDRIFLLLNLPLPHMVGRATFCLIFLLNI